VEELSQDLWKWKLTPHGMKIIRACLFDGEGKGGGPLALPWLLVPVTQVIALMLRHLKTRK
jgi:hypothetical protein